MDRIEIVCPHCHQLNVRYTRGFGGLLNPRNPGCCTVCGAELATGRFGAVDWPYMAVMFVAVYFFHIFLWGAILVIPAALVARLAGAPTADVQIVMWISFAAAVVAGIASAERTRRKGQMLYASEALPGSVATSSSGPASAAGDSCPASPEVASVYGAGARIVTPTRKRLLVPWSLLLLFGPMFVLMAFTDFRDRRALVRDGEVVEGTDASIGSRRVSHSDRRTVTVAFVTPSGVRGKVTGDSETLKSGDRVPVRFVPSRPDVAEIEREGETSLSLFHPLIPLFMGLAMILGSIGYLLDWQSGPAAKGAPSGGGTPVN